MSLGTGAVVVMVPENVVWIDSLLLPFPLLLGTVRVAVFFEMRLSKESLEESLESSVRSQLVSDNETAGLYTPDDIVLFWLMGDEKRSAEWDKDLMEAKFGAACDTILWCCVMFSVDHGITLIAGDRGKRSSATVTAKVRP